MSFNVKQSVNEPIKIADGDGIIHNIAFFNADINSDLTGYNMMLQIIDKQRYQENINEVRNQYQQLIDFMNSKLEELNYNLIEKTL